jgi:intracellular sulfur oxidation DsrE/DsrF family protein
MKVVFHLSTVRVDVVKKVFRNMSNILEENESVEVHCVVNTDGVTILREDSNFKDNIEDLTEKGVSFKACSNSIEGTSDMTVEEVSRHAEVVDSAVLELTRLQHNGFGYIRP